MDFIDCLQELGQISYFCSSGWVDKVCLFRSVIPSLYFKIDSWSICSERIQVLLAAEGYNF